MRRKKQNVRIWKNIPQNHQTTLPRKILILDTETRTVRVSDIETREHMILAWTCLLERRKKDTRGYTEKYKYWENTERLWEYVSSLCTGNTTLYIVGSFVLFDLMASDFFETMYFFGWQFEFCYNNQGIFILVIYREKAHIKVVSIQNYIPGSVEEYGRLVGIPKGKVRFDTATKEQLKPYCLKDVIITKEVLKGYIQFLIDNDCGKFCLTRSSQAFQAFRHNFMTKTITIHPDPHTLKLERKAFFGGRVEAFRLGDFKGKRFVYLDINSMYPYVMAANEYPCRYKQPVPSPRLSYIESALEDYAVIASVVLKTDVPIYPVRHDGKTLFPVGEFHTYLCTGGLKEAYQRGHIKRIYNAALYECANLFQDYVEYWYPLKQMYRKKNNPLYAELVKVFLNALYGKFAQFRPKKIYEGKYTERPFFYENWFDYDKATWKTTQVMFGWREEYEGREETTNSCPSIAAHVTEYGRLLLWSLIERVGIENVYYCDTDSLIIEEKYLSVFSDILDSERLGSLSERGRTDSLSIYGCKDYIWHNEEVLKGIRKDAEKISSTVFEQDMLPSLKTALQLGKLCGYPVIRKRKKLKRTYDKGVVHRNGRVTPFVFPFPSPLFSQPPEHAASAES